MRLLITGGGTGGHIYPALAIARGLLDRQSDSTVLYVGTKQGLEADIVPKAGLDFRTVTVQGMPRKLSPELFRFGWKLFRGLGEARNVIREYKPDLVVGTGGYVCGPVVMLAALAGVPTLLHEQNALPGITNKLLARKVGMVAITFEEAAKYFPKGTRLLHTGLPIREEILKVDRLSAFARLGLNPEKRLVVVTGGSRGARSLNQAMIKAYGKLANHTDTQILHVTGQQLYQETLDGLTSAGIDWMESGNINIKPYLYNMEDALAAADLMVCRAGATTLAEITARGIPSILIPYPFAAENHQEYNARALEQQGAAFVIRDSDLKDEDLAQRVLGLFADKGRLESMGEASLAMGRPQALEQILNAMGVLVKRS
ncbi:MAG TPA: undecaprenyldiphospho-muramoylpentapeptide beta-N-acetylglucosaminyltransferase [Bacillota bacterium]|nr:undecaprenyldiphospho-muramoylpentapeptide beta-N-acetylglucosaminyltransferase [Bacillota bacterium]